MSWLDIDEERCTKCGLCADDCPFGEFLFKEAGVPNEAMKSFCIHCGHCAAICPEDAVCLDGVKDEELPAVADIQMPKFEEVAHLMRTRRSTRAFTSEPLSREALGELIGAAHHAPSGGNVRSVRWLVITEAEKKKKVITHISDWMEEMAKDESLSYAPFMKVISAKWKEAGEDRILWDAPALVIASASPRALNPAVDCTIALTTLELAAWAQGVGTCWAGFLTWCATAYPPLAKELSLPEGHKVQGAMLLGHPAREYKRIPVRRGPQVSWE
jgi:nitroreductase/Pyruvate/2-oxoacid:ferredoxin oxidoreductase delta subunit